MKNIRDAQHVKIRCKNKIIGHIEKQFNKYNLSPLDNLCEVKEDFPSGNLELLCEHNLGNVCQQFLDAIIQKRVELGRPLNEKEINDVITDIIKNINAEDKEKIIEFQKYLDNNRDKKPMYPDSEAADEALAH